jgi:hypothetical protein
LISLQLAWYLFVLFLFSEETMFIWLFRGRRGRIVVGFTTTCASCEFDSRSWRGVFDTTWCDAVCQWHATGRWISLGTLVSPTNKTHRHDITEISLKVPLNTITLTIYGYSCLVIDLYTFNQNGQSRDTGNIGGRTKTNITQHRKLLHLYTYIVTSDKSCMWNNLRNCPLIYGYVIYSSSGYY